MKNSRIVLMVKVFSCLAISLTNCDIEQSMPEEVSGLSIAGGDGEVTVNWIDPGSIDLDHIEITWTPNDPLDPVIVSPGVESVTIAGLTNGTEYTFTLLVLHCAPLPIPPSVVDVHTRTSFDRLRSSLSRPVPMEMMASPSSKKEPSSAYMLATTGSHPAKTFSFASVSSLMHVRILIVQKICV